MLNITFRGGSSSYFDEAFFYNNGELRPDASNQYASIFTLTNTDTGAVTQVYGNGFTYDQDGDPESGTITGFNFAQNGVEVAGWSGITWDLVAFISALQQLENGSDTTFLSDLLSGQDIMVNGTGSTTGMDVGTMLGADLGITSDITVMGTSFDDVIETGAGDDTVRVGSGESVVFGSLGNDLIDYSSASGPLSFSELNYGRISVGITATIDANTGSGTVTATDSADFLNNVQIVMQNEGLRLVGTTQGDTFNIDSLNNGFLYLYGDNGDDIFNINMASGGRVRLDYHGNYGYGGIEANLVTGRIYDGLGGSDTLNIINANSSRMIEIRGTDFNDNFIGSDMNERFILRGGNDSLDGGGGDLDLVRFDRGSMTSGVTFDMNTGVATGTWNGDAFSHQISNVEHVIGSDDFADEITGDGADNLFDGNGGNDTLEGGGGNDTLNGGNQEDLLRGGAGDDVLSGDAGFDVLFGDGGNDLLRGGGQADNLHGGAGEDSLYGDQGFDRLFGGTGNDLGYGGTGTDGLFGQQGNDTLYGQQDEDRVFGGQGNDLIDGGSENDVLFGGAGFDTIIGGTGNDAMAGNFNADTFVFADFGGGFGQDTITDFDANNDFERIDLSRVASITDLADLLANHVSQVGNDVVIDALGGNTITLLNVDLNDLGAFDFTF